MAPGSSLDGPAGEALLRVARDSLAHGVRAGAPLAVTPDDQPAALRREGACFVTLRKEAALRGCIGSLEATRSLVVDAAENAYAAGFRDPRFPGVGAHELAAIAVHLSVLSPTEPIACGSEDELLEQLRPEVDGLVLQEGDLRSTFLPAVWEGLREPRTFLCELRKKAGLPPDHWSPTLRFWRYTVQEIG